MKKPFYKVLYVQVLAAIVIGVLLGFFFPDIGASMKPLGDGFIKLIKMLIAPVIFCTVVIGIAGMEDMKKVGKVGGIALLYFEIVTTLALLVGLFLVNVLQPGAGMHVDPATLDVNSVSMYATAEKPQSTLDFIFHIIPSSVVGAFAQGDILQVLFFSIIFGFALQFLFLHRWNKSIHNLRHKALEAVCEYYRSQYWFHLKYWFLPLKESWAVYLARFQLRHQKSEVQYPHPPSIR